MIRRLVDSPTVSTWIALAVRMGGMLVLTPLVLRRFSPEEIAVWYLFVNIVALASLADLGFTPTFVRMVAFVLGGATDLRDLSQSRAAARTGVIDWVLMGRLYRTMSSVYILLSGVLLLTMATVGTLVVRRTVTALPNPMDGWIAWAGVVTALVVSFNGARWTATLQGLNQVPKANQATAAGGLAATLGGACALLAGGGLCVTVIVYQFLNISTVFLNRWILSRDKDWSRVDARGLGWDREMLHAAWPAAWRSAIVIAFSTGITNSFGLMYAQMASSATLASFLLTSRIVNLVVTISQAPFYSKTPLFARLRAQASYDDLSRTTARAMTLSILVLILGCIGLALCGNYILTLLDAKVHLLNQDFILTWSVVYLLERHHAMHAQIYCTTNRIPFYVPIAISGVINLALVWWLLPHWGVWAFIAGHGISNLMINNWWNVKMSLGSLPREWWKRYWRPPLVGAGGFLVAALALWAERLWSIP